MSNDIDSPSFVERFLGKLGYEKRGPVVPIEYQPEANSDGPPIPAHRSAQAGFDYARAKLGGMAFHYHDGDDRYSYAIGKDNWIPVSIAAMMLGMRDRETLRLVEQYAGRAMWLHADSAQFSAWVKANDEVFRKLSRFEVEPATGAAADQSTGWPEDFAQMGPIEVSFQYRLCWKRVYPDLTEEFLAVSSAHADFSRLSVARNVETALSELHGTLKKFAEYWFEARGFVVDRDLHLINVEGYEALFYSAEQAC